MEKNFELDQSGVCTVGLLPFINDSRFEQGDVIVKRVFAAELNRLAGIEVSSEGDVRSIYRQLKIFPNQQPNIEQLRVLGSRLGVQYLIGGRISAMEENVSSNQMNPLLSVTLQTYDAKSGKTLWVTHYRREGSDYRTIMHFGVVNTITELSRIMSDEIIEKWFLEGMTRCEK